MFIFLTILLFLLSSLAMLVLRLVRPRLSIQGFLAVITVIAGLVMILIAKSEIPSSSNIFSWAPASLLPVSPFLLIDNTSWTLSLAIVALAATLIITSIAQMGRTPVEANIPGNTKNQVGEAEPGLTTQFAQNPQAASSQNSILHWLYWVAVLVCTSLGLVAATAGNLLTLLLAWAALDMVEFAILIGHSLKSENRERAAILYSVKLAGILLLLTASLVNWSQIGSLNFTDLSSSTTILLALAAALRLGVVPPFFPFAYRFQARQDLATLTYLVPAAGSYILLVRFASYGAASVFTPYLLALAAVVGLVSAIQWLSASDEQIGKRYWLVGCATFALASALLGQTGACLAWSVACLLSGGLVFSFTLRHRNLIPILILGMINFSFLPFSATWQTSFLYKALMGYSPEIWLNSLFTICFLLAQSALLAGFIRHLLRGIIPPGEVIPTPVERWVWTLYPLGLFLVTTIQLFLGILTLPDLNGLPIFLWVMGPIVLFLSAVFIFLAYRTFGRRNLFQRLSNVQLLKQVFSNEWLYNLVWNSYRLISRILTLISTILEGEGGILWALVLFALIFIFLQR